MVRIDFQSGTSLACRASNSAVRVSTAESIASANRFPEIQRPVLRAPRKINIQRRNAMVVCCHRSVGNQTGTTVSDNQIEPSLDDAALDFSEKRLPSGVNRFRWNQ